MILQFIKRMLLGRPKTEIVIPDYEVWFNLDEKLWTAQFKDKYDNQIGDAGFGTNRQSALDDLFYVNVDMLQKDID